MQTSPKTTAARTQPHQRINDEIIDLTQQLAAAYTKKADQYCKENQPFLVYQNIKESIALHNKLVRLRRDFS